MMKRREFLIGSCCAMVVAGLGVGKAWASGAVIADASAGSGMTNWQALLNQNFRLWLSSSSSQVLTLIDLQKHVATIGSGPQMDQFSLTFAGDPSMPIAEGTYVVCEIMDPSNGNFPLHLQPMGTDASQALYRSDFNLLT